MKIAKIKNVMNSFAKKWDIEMPIVEKRSKGIVEIRTELVSYDYITKYLYKAIEKLGYIVEYEGSCIYLAIDDAVVNGM